MSAKPTATQHNALHIGATKESIQEARATIMDILGASCDQETKRTALNTLNTLCAVNNASVNNCQFTIPAR